MRTGTILAAILVSLMLAGAAVADADVKSCGVKCIKECANSSDFAGCMVTCIRECDSPTLPVEPLPEE